MKKTTRTSEDVSNDHNSSSMIALHLLDSLACTATYNPQMFSILETSNNVRSCGWAIHLSTALGGTRNSLCILFTGSYLWPEVGTPWPQEAITPGFHLLQQDQVYFLMSEALQ